MLTCCRGWLPRPHCVDGGNQQCDAIDIAGDRIAKEGFNSDLSLKSSQPTIRHETALDNFWDQKSSGAVDQVQVGKTDQTSSGGSCGFSQVKSNETEPWEPGPEEQGGRACGVLR